MPSGLAERGARERADEEHCRQGVEIADRDRGRREQYQPLDARGKAQGQFRSDEPPIELPTTIARSSSRRSQTRSTLCA